MVSSLDLLHLAQTAAERAAAYLRGVERPRGSRAAGRVKGSRDFVTEVDRTAERDRRARSCWPPSPGSRIVGEELSPDAGRPTDWSGSWIRSTAPPTSCTISRATRCRSRRRWTACSRPASCIARAAPATVYTRGPRAAARGRASAGSRSRRIADPAFALIGTGFPVQGHRAAAASTRSSSRRVAARTSGIRRPGSAALDLADVAAGGSTASGSSGSSAVGHRGRHAAGPRGGRRGDRLRGPRRRDRAYRARGAGTRRYTPGCWRRDVAGRAPDHETSQYRVLGVRTMHLRARLAVTRCDLAARSL